MNEISAVGNSSGAAAAMERNDTPETAQQIAVLRKALSADKDLASELLPQPHRQGGRLDIQA